MVYTARQTNYSHWHPGQTFALRETFQRRKPHVARRGRISVTNQMRPMHARMRPPRPTYIFGGVRARTSQPCRGHICGRPAEPPTHGLCPANLTPTVPRFANPGVPFRAQNSRIPGRRNTPPFFYVWILVRDSPARDLTTHVVAVLVSQNMHVLAY